jgi:hypothetical protein
VFVLIYVIYLESAQGNETITPQLAAGIMADIWRGFWTRETRTGQEVAQLRDRYMMMMMMTWKVILSFVPVIWWELNFVIRIIRMHASGMKYTELCTDEHKGT